MPDKAQSMDQAVLAKIPVLFMLKQITPVTTMAAKSSQQKRKVKKRRIIFLKLLAVDNAQITKLAIVSRIVPAFPQWTAFQDCWTDPAGLPYRADICQIIRPPGHRVTSRVQMGQPDVRRGLTYALGLCYTCCIMSNSSTLTIRLDSDIKAAARPRAALLGISLGTLVENDLRRFINGYTIIIDDDSFVPSEKLRHDIAAARLDETDGDYDDVAAADVADYLDHLTKADR